MRGAVMARDSRLWMFLRDPLFVEKAGPILDLYQGLWQGQPLGPQDFVLFADEKSGIQARHREHPALPPAPGRAAFIASSLTLCPPVRAGSIWWNAGLAN